MNKGDKSMKKKTDKEKFIKCRNYIFNKKDLMYISKDGKHVEIYLVINDEEHTCHEWFENIEEATEEYNNIFEQLQRKKLDKRIINKKKYKITLTKFWNSKKLMAIHCNTKEKAKKLLKAFDKLGKKWHSGESYTKESYYNDDSRSTCYNNNRKYGYYNDYKESYKIYEFEDVDLEN